MRNILIEDNEMDEKTLSIIIGGHSYVLLELITNEEQKDIFFTVFNGMKSKSFVKDKSYMKMSVMS